MAWQRYGNSTSFGSLGSRRGDDYNDRDTFRSGGGGGSSGGVGMRDFDRNGFSDRDSFRSSGITNVDRFDLQVDSRNSFGGGRSTQQNNFDDIMQQRRNFPDEGNSFQRNNYSENSVRELLNMVVANGFGQQNQGSNYPRNNQSFPKPLLSNMGDSRMDYQRSSRNDYSDRRSRNQYSDRRSNSRRDSPRSSRNTNDSNSSNNRRMFTEVVELNPEKVRFLAKRRLGFIERQYNCTITMDKNKNKNGKIHTTIKIAKNVPFMRRNVSKAVEMLHKMVNTTRGGRSGDDGKKPIRKSIAVRALGERPRKEIKLDESCIIKINLRLSIVDDEPITEERVVLLKKHLSTKVDEALESGIVVRFRSMNLVKGELRITCVDEKSLEWLKNTVNAIPELWEKSKLRFVFVDTKHHYRIKIFLQGAIKSNEMILRLLAGQNPTISVKEWEIYHIDEKEKDGAVYYIGVDEASLNDLIKGHMKMYYEFSLLEFRMIRTTGKTNTVESADAEEKK